MPPLHGAVGRPAVSRLQDRVSCSSSHFKSRRHLPAVGAWSSVVAAKVGSRVAAVAVLHLVAAGCGALVDVADEHAEALWNNPSQIAILKNDTFVYSDDESSGLLTGLKAVI